MNHFLSKRNLQTNTFILKVTILSLAICVWACNEHNMNTEFILIEEGDYMYPARVKEAYAASDLQIQVYIFNDAIREKIGNSISTSKIASKRDKPMGGWGTRQVAVQYFLNEEWIYTEDATEFETYYLIPINTTENKKIEIKYIRFPIPIQR